MADSSTPAPNPSARLQDLRGQRTAPELQPRELADLRRELQPLLAACDWFTIGVMAPSGAEAEAVLRAWEGALSWSPLELDPASARPQDVAGPAFLKGNQNTGRFLLRPESGLGQGVLITGHSRVDPAAEDTWGPFPLDFFAEPGTAGTGP